MNPYTPLLSNAVNAASLNTQATREFIYRQARKSLQAHLAGGDHPSTEEQIHIELQRLDDAILAIEATMAQAAPFSVGDARATDPHQGDPGDSELRPDSVRIAPEVQSDSPGDPAGPRSARRFWVFPPLQVSGFVLKIIALLSNPYFLLVSLGLGLYIGVYSKTATALLSPVADLYIELLKMVLIPFMISAIVVSLSRLFGSEAMHRHIAMILTMFLSGLAAVALLGLFAGVVLSPGGDISFTSRQALGQLINQSPYAVDLEVALNEPAGGSKELHNGTLFEQVIPDNIFRALTTGDNLKILFFAVAFGVGLGSLRMNRGEGLRIALLSVYDVCTQLIAWVNMLLPVALCAMVAKQVAAVGTAQLVAMIRFTIGFGLSATAVCICSILVLAWASRSSVVQALRAIREPLLLAVATRSSITCIPASMTALIDKLGYQKEHVELLLPLGITLFRFGPVLYYAFTTIFVAQLYGIEVSPSGYIVAFAGAMLTGLASAGTTGVLTISLLGIIFQPLGLPLEAALALLVTVDPIIDIFRTAIIVVPNVAAVAAFYRKDRSAKPGGLAFGAQRKDALS